MFARRRYIMTPREYNWNHSYINGLVFVILLLTSSVEIIADNVNITEGGSSQEINCTLYRSCTQCTGAHSGCSWLIEKQICLNSNQILSGKFIVDTKESCPAYAVTYDGYSLQVTVSNIEAKSVKTFFNVSPNIGCEIENATYNASIDNGVITCNWEDKKTIPIEKQRTTKANPLFIFYFSIVVNNVRLQFDNPRDHYISYHGWTCPKENCTISFWESDSKKYYCKWCLKNDSCKITAEQLNSCDIRNAVNNEKWKDGAPPSTIEVRSPDVAIESFKPDVLLFHRNTPTVVSITVKNHRFLAEGRLTTVTLAGQSCDESVTVDDKTVNCTVSCLKEVKEGPVVIEYAGITSVLRLKSAQKFRFVEPKFTDVSPSCVPFTGGTRIELIGENLNTTTDLQVFFRNIMTKVMCDIVELKHDRIVCVTSPHTDEQKSGPLQIVFEKNSIGKFYKKKMFTYVNEPTVLDGQVFEGLASGDVSLTVRGEFECTENQQMYVDYNGTRYYGNCMVRNNSNSTMDCWPPKLDDPGQMTSLSLGFRVDLAGKVVNFPQQTPYLLHPDPVYTDFEVFDGTVVRVEGVFPDLLQRRRPNGSYIFEVTYRGDELDDDERFTMINVTENYIECRSSFDTSVADILEIAITVDKQVKRTVVQRRHRRYYAIVRLMSPQHVIGGISALLICVFALIFCVKKIMNSSKQHMDKRYIGELRNITAGIDDTTDYLLNSNTGKRPKTRH
ncbi:plexin-A1-like [Metopolophium dirhodum]|uniref:plexin-A1-like n=1 Tax=Metopolophium dirhodum TaxID=44670 RepID=UPI00298FCCA6|nr:plexin-A1-like [Metopolophium dirhodum]